MTSSASAALMSKIPPQHFCSTVLRLIALHVISLGEGYSLENTCGGHGMFSTHTRTENVLLNLLIPLFLRVGTGRKGITHFFIHFLSLPNKEKSINKKNCSRE